jgi:hypothetical protein
MVWCELNPSQSHKGGSDNLICVSWGTEYIPPRRWLQDSLRVLCVFMTFPLPQSRGIVEMRAAATMAAAHNYGLLADAQLPDQSPVLGNIFLLQIFEQVSTLADQFQQTAAGMMIFGMRFKMLGEIHDPFGQQGNLHLARTGIGFVGLKFFNEFFFLLYGLRHWAPPSLSFCYQKSNFPQPLLESG